MNKPNCLVRLCLSYCFDLGAGIVKKCTLCTGGGVCSYLSRTRPLCLRGPYSGASRHSPRIWQFWQGTKGPLASQEDRKNWVGSRKGTGKARTPQRSEEPEKPPPDPLLKSPSRKDWNAPPTITPHPTVAPPPQGAALLRVTGLTFFLQKAKHCSNTITMVVSTTTNLLYSFTT